MAAKRDGATQPDVRSAELSTDSVADTGADAHAESGVDASSRERLRIDRWLWFARFFKSRRAASQVANARRIRIAGRIVAKASHAVKIGDILTFPQARVIRIVKIVALGSRRGPASEARTLYEDLAPPAAAAAPDRRRKLLEAGLGVRDAGSGRPTKSQRRALDRLRGND